MDRLRAMQVFVRIVEAGSLTAAADALDLSVPAVVRSLAALERAVGVRLLNRTTRRSSLSDEGREYYEHCRHVLSEIETADAALSARRAEPKGRLRLTAPVIYGRTHLAPVVMEFARKHRRVEVELLLLDRIVDLVEEGIDAAIRISHLPESSLVAVPVAETRRVLCASPGYLNSAGTPATPGDLAAHRCVQFSGLSSGNTWSFGGKAPTQVPIRPALRTNQFDVALDAVLQGFGCGQFLHYQVEALLAKRRLRRILGAFEPPAVPIQIVYPHSRLLSPNVRTFVDLAVARLRSRGGRAPDLRPTPG